MFTAALARLLAEILAFRMLRYPAVWTTLFVLGSCFFLFVALHKPTSIVYWVLGATLGLLVVVPLLFKRQHNRLVGFLALVLGIGAITLPRPYRSFDTVLGEIAFIASACTDSWRTGSANRSAM